MSDIWDVCWKTNLQHIVGPWVWHNTVFFAVAEEVVEHRFLCCALLRVAQPVRDLFLNLFSGRICKHAVWSLRRAIGLNTGVKSWISHQATRLTWMILRNNFKRREFSNYCKLSSNAKPFTWRQRTPGKIKLKTKQLMRLAAMYLFILWDHMTEYFTIFYANN